MKNFTYVLFVFIVVCSCSSPENQFQRAEETRSKELFEKIIIKYPDAKEADKAKIRVADIESWEKIKENPEKELLKTYLGSFDDGLYKEEAKNKLEEIEAFEITRETDTIEDYNLYLKKYVDSNFTQYIKKRIKELTPVETEFNTVKNEINTAILSVFINAHKNTGYAKIINKIIEEINKEHPVYKAEFLDFENFGRFTVHQAKKFIIFGVNKGFYGTFVNYDNGNLINGIFAIGAQYVFKGTVTGFLGYTLDSDERYPLTFESVKEGLKYICGKGYIMDKNGNKYELNAVDISKWLIKLEKGDIFQRRAAAQALGWISSSDYQTHLLKALKDEDKIVRCLAAESLIKIGNSEIISALRDTLRDTEDRLNKEKSKYGNGQFYMEINAATEAPLESWRLARFKVSSEGMVSSEKTIILNRLVQLLKQGIRKLEKG